MDDTLDPDASLPIPQAPTLVGIGASAGGLEALKQLLPGLPPGPAYVVLQHLAPTHRSMLAEILGPRTTMPVHEMRDGDLPQSGEILITPPNAHVEFDGQRLRLTAPEPHSVPRPSINLFFASLARHLGPRATGVILSGTGSDGALGLRQLRAAGGSAFVQQPASARYTGMPESAIRLIGHDQVLTPEQIGPALGRLLLQADGADGNADLLPPAELDEDQLADLLARVRRRCGIDFSEYKEGTLLRRIGRRMLARDSATLEEYLALCREDGEELDQLARDTLISVTAFWRDREAFDALAAKVRERLTVPRNEAGLRVWVAGCATGEEAYSLAMVYAEALGDRLVVEPLQIFATDIDLEALAIARRGLYPAAALAELPEALRARYFTRVGTQYEFSRALRERVVFSRHDLTRDPPFRRLDLVSCRNVLIYLKQQVQARVMRSFHYALQPQGLLFLGRSESVLHHEDLFSAFDKEQRLYHRSSGSPDSAARPMIGDTLLPRLPPSNPQRRAAVPDAEVHLLRLAAEHYLPACVLLDERLQVLQVHGDVGRFFTLRPGTQTYDVMSLARPEIEPEMRLLCALLGDSDSPRHADITLGRGRGQERWRMVLHPSGGGLARRRTLLSFQPRARGTRQRSPVASDEAQAATQADLNDARERLKSLVEQLEASNEELQALNEEAQATNEELQSSNEELEAANEEMQATNEELATVNAELNHQWRRYQQLSEELQSIHNSIDLPLLVIDAGHGIRRYNEAAAQLFRLSPGCEGLHLSTMTRPPGLPDLLGFVQQAQNSASPQVLHLPRTDDGREYVLHLTHDVLGGERRGMVLTPVDNTELARAERHTRSAC